MEYYAAIRNDEFVSFVGTWMNLETIILSKLTQEQKIKPHVLTHSFSEMEFHSCCPGWSAMVGSWLTATSASQLQSLALLPRVALAHHNLHLPSSSNSHASASQVAETTDREIPGRGATRVASATLLAGAAGRFAGALARRFPVWSIRDGSGSAGPIPTRRTAIGSAED
ncbi:retrotransposable element ORF2 protein [Plecturocebus cupreus]